MENYYFNHNTFGGKVYIGDFDRKTTLSEIAERITYDQRFDQRCRQNLENQQRNLQNLHTKQSFYGGKHL
jgi:hypothetical protein